MARRNSRTARKRNGEFLFFFLIIASLLASVAHSAYYMRAYELERRIAEIKELDVRKERNELLKEQNELLKILIRERNFYENQEKK